MMLNKEIDLSDIYDFVENGNPDNVPQGIVEYLELLNKVYGMTNRTDKFGSKQMIVKHLVKADGLSHYKASKLYNESIEYFYNEVGISKNALRNFYASIMEKAMNFSIETMKDASDGKKIADMAKMIAETKGAFDEEPEVLSPELFRTPFIIYSCDADFLGLPKVDRNRLGSQIDAYPELSEKERVHIKREAGILPIKIFPNEQEDARKA